MNKKAIIRKVKHIGDDIPAAEMEDFVLGAVNDGVSLPVDYTIRGIITCLEIGRPMVVARTHRNDVEVDGITQTSIVKDIRHTKKKLVVETQNSEYHIELLDEDD